MTRKSVLTLINKCHNNLTKKEQLIADFIIKNPELVSSSTINEISQKLNIADSTLYRFIRKIGYSGMREFYLDLSVNDDNMNVTVHENIRKSDDYITMANKVFESTIISLEDSLKVMNQESLEKAEALLTNSRIIGFYGLGGSNIVAQDAYHKFLRTPFLCQTAIDFHTQLMQCAQLTSKDCAIIICHSGIDKQAIEIAEVLKNNNTSFIVVTSYPLSKLAKMADIVFISISEETTYRSEALSSRIAQLAIIDTLYIISMFHNELPAEKSLKKMREAISQTKDV